MDKNKFQFPNKIKISRMEDYHTHYLGKFEDGNLFFGYPTFTFDEHRNIEEDWRKYRNEYVVLYLFSSDGKYLKTKYKSLGKAIDNQRLDNDEKIEELLEEFGEYHFSDIEVEPFSLEIDGHQFGLIPDEETEFINLQPMSTISFYEPWDGEYDT
jgi:hypothetical protein